MTQTDTIRTRADGSIDIEYYTRIGRRMRSEQALEMLTAGKEKRARPRRKRTAFFSFF